MKKDQKTTLLWLMVLCMSSWTSMYFSCSCFTAVITTASSLIISYGLFFWSSISMSCTLGTSPTIMLNIIIFGVMVGILLLKQNLYIPSMWAVNVYLLLDSLSPLYIPFLSDHVIFTLMSGKPPTTTLKMRPILVPEVTSSKKHSYHVLRYWQSSLRPWPGTQAALWVSPWYSMSEA